MGYHCTGAKHKGRSEQIIHVRRTDNNQPAGYCLHNVDVEIHSGTYLVIIVVTQIMHYAYKRQQADEGKGKRFWILVIKHPGVIVFDK